MVWDITFDATSAGYLQKVIEELNGHEEALIELANNATNQHYVNVDHEVRIKWATWYIWVGTSKGAEFKQETLIAKCYNACYVKMKGKLISGNYESIPANTILTDICAAAGVTLGTCPTTAVSVKFSNATCFDAAKFLAMSLNKDFWASAGATTFNIGDRGTTHSSVTIMGVSRRGTDRATQGNRVLVRGYDPSGNIIYGEAKSAGWDPGNDHPTCFNEKKATDTATLNSIAAYYLRQIERESCGVKVDVDLDSGYNIYPGDLLPVTSTQLNLSGNYKVWKTTKKLTVVECDIDVPESGTDKYLMNEKDLADAGIFYPPMVSPANLQNLSMEGCVAKLSFDELKDLYVFKDDSGYRNDGITVGGCTSVAGKFGKAVQLNGTTGFVQIPHEDSLQLDKITIMMWVKPTYQVLGSYPRLSSKWGGGVTAFDWWMETVSVAQAGWAWNIYIGGVQNTVASWDTGGFYIDYGQWQFLCVTFDGTTLKAYKNGKLGPSKSVTPGVLDKTAYPIYFGGGPTMYFQNGQIDETRIFNRACSDAEIYTAYCLGPISQGYDLREIPRFEVEDAPMAHSGDSVVETDATCSKQKRVHITAAIAEGYFFWGPYTKVGSGEFYAVFCLASSVGSGTSNLCRIDVYSNTVGSIVSQYILTPDDFVYANYFRTFAIRFRARSDISDYEFRCYRYAGVADLYADFVGFAPADNPIANVEVLNQTLGIPNSNTTNVYVQDQSLGIPGDNNQNLHVNDLSLGIPSDDSAGISWTQITDSGWSAAKALTPSSFQIIQQWTVSAAAYSQPMIVRLMVRRTSGNTGWGDVWFKLFETATERHIWSVYLGGENPGECSIWVCLPLIYTSATITSIYGMGSPHHGVNISVDVRQIWYAKTKHLHSITEASPYRGQNDLDYTAHWHSITEPTPYRGQNDLNNVNHLHPITEPGPPYRGVDKTAGYGTKRHIH